MYLRKCASILWPGPLLHFCAVTVKCSRFCALIIIYKPILEAFGPSSKEILIEPE